MAMFILVPDSKRVITELFRVLSRESCCLAIRLSFLLLIGLGLLDSLIGDNDMIIGE